MSAKKDLSSIVDLSTNVESQVMWSNSRFSPFPYLGRSITHFLHLVPIFEKFCIQLTNLDLDGINTLICLFAKGRDREQVTTVSDKGDYPTHQPPWAFCLGVLSTTIDPFSFECDDRAFPHPPAAREVERGKELSCPLRLFPLVCYLCVQFPNGFVLSPASIDSLFPHNVQPRLHP